MRRIIRPSPLIGATMVGSRASTVSSYWAAAGVAAGPQDFPETVQVVRRVAVVVALGPIQGGQRSRPMDLKVMLEEFPQIPVRMIGVRAVVAAVLGARVLMRVHLTPSVVEVERV